MNARVLVNDIRSIVIVGNGVAAIAATRHARCAHPTCEVHLVSWENHAPDERIRTAHAINSRSGTRDRMPPQSPIQTQRIRNRLNARAVEIDTDRCRVRLATGEHIAYDRLILADGDSIRSPVIDGFSAPGSFAVSKSDGVNEISSYAREHNAHTAVIAGASLLDLEAAFRLRTENLKVIVLSDSEHILNHQLDIRGSRLLQRQLGSRGIDILVDAEAVAVSHDRHGVVCSVRLNDGRILPTDIVVACQGASPHVELAKAAGLATRHGVLVDDYMQTSEADIYAAGDTAEHDGITLCPASLAVEQGEIAACNALGGKRRYRGQMRGTSLQSTGIDLLSIGQIDANSNGVYSIIDEQPGSFKYRKLVFTARCLLGAILIGHPDETSLVSNLVKRGANLTPVISALHSGRWNELVRLEVAV